MTTRRIVAVWQWVFVKLFIIHYVLNIITQAQIANGGKCGICGDNYLASRPREHELRGKYGDGTIIKKYRPGSIINTHIILTANHMGFFTFDICKVLRGRETDECFKPVQFSDKTFKFKVNSNINNFYPEIIIPSTMTCDHCVLRWTYTAGNGWGVCPMVLEL